MRKCLIVSLLLSQLCFAQTPWEKKPFEKWSAKEINHFLADSPWAKTIHVMDVNPTVIDESAIGSRRRSAAETSSLSEESAPRITYRVQLRSAQPIRLAIARKSVLDSKPETLSPEQRQSLDANVKQFLSQTFDDTVVIQVTFNSNAPTVAFEARQYWMAQTVESLQDKLILSVGETNLAPEWFEADASLFQVRFKRPPVTAETKIALRFVSPAAGFIKEQNVVANFNAKEMTYLDAISF